MTSYPPTKQQRAGQCVRRLVAAFRQASHGGSRVAALIGAAGLGETRLLSAFREWVVLDSPGVEIWDGRLPALPTSHRNAAPLLRDSFLTQPAFRSVLAEIY